MSPAKDAALGYLRRGLSVIPIRPVNKRPRVAWQEYQQRRATEAEVAAWFENHSDAGVGIVTGAVSGVLVLDVDGEEGRESLKRFEPVPVTWRASTARGEHYYFRHRGRVVSNFAKRLAGLDLRGDGGYVVAPPSVHPSGSRYEWVIPPDEVDLAECPPWLLDLIRQSGGDNGEGAPFTVPEKIREGARNDRLYRLARALKARGLDPEEILATLETVNGSRCEPPLPAPEVREIAEHAATQPDRPTFQTEHVARSDGSRPVLVTLATVEPEEVSWLWPGRLAVGKLTLLIGDPGLGKSLLTLDMSARISRGTAWPDGGFAPQGNVILLSAEDGLADTIRPRLEAAGGSLERVHVLRAVRDDAGERHFTLARDLEELELAITQTGAGLVVIDPVSAYLGDKDSYKDSEVRALLAPLAALAERQRVAVVAVMHLTKDQQRRALYRALGSVAFVAAARVVLAVARDPEDTDRRVVVTIKSNLARPAPGLAFKIVEAPSGAPVLAWESDPVTGADADRLLGPGPSADERAEGQEADDFLREILASGRVKAEAVLKAARKAGIAERTLYRAKRRLGVRSTHDGPPGTPGPWWWTFPETAMEVATEAATFGQVAISVQPGDEKAESAPTSTEIATQGTLAISGGNLRDSWGEV